VGSDRSHRVSSAVSMTVAFPDFRAVNSSSRMAPKMRVLENPVTSAASSGVNDNRGKTSGRRG
jgi:hypothetical protein